MTADLLALLPCEMPQHDKQPCEERWDRDGHHEHEEADAS
jgi:hypothetical protein